jgi:hypothetical protein
VPRHSVDGEEVLDHGQLYLVAASVFKRCEYELTSNLIVSETKIKRTLGSDREIGAVYPNLQHFAISARPVVKIKPEVAHLVKWQHQVDQGAKSTEAQTSRQESKLQGFRLMQ